jgi:hypothetical protein
MLLLREFKVIILGSDNMMHTFPLQKCSWQENLMMASVWQGLLSPPQGLDK